MCSASAFPPASFRFHRVSKWSPNRGGTGWSKCMESEDTFDPSGDNSIDDFLKMLSLYSCKRKTNRLSLITLSKMVDVSALNAYLIYTDVHPKWKPNTGREKRRQFLHERGASLVSAQAARRRHMLGGSSSLFSQFPAKAKEADSKDCNEGVGESSQRKRCAYCAMEKGSKFALQTRLSCKSCGKSICSRTHIATVCVYCYKEANDKRKHWSK